MNRLEAHIDRRCDVFEDATIPADQFDVVLAFEHGMKRIEFFTAHRGNAGLDPAHARCD